MVHLIRAFRELGPLKNISAFRDDAFHSKKETVDEDAAVKSRFEKAYEAFNGDIILIIEPIINDHERFLIERKKQISSK
uniref:HEPN domain-containing protein n=1 Tax=Strongyloides venezuelensis TaxID=75913 RepID=A0A0K0FJ48_STRVS